MFKFETLVLAFIIIFAHVGVQAADPKTINDKCSEQFTVRLKACELEFPADQPQKNDCIGKAREKFNNCGEKTSGGCDAADEKYDEALSKFSSACESAEISQEGGTGEGHDRACSKALRQCTEYKNTSRDEKGSRLSESRRKLEYDLDSEKKKFEFCPHMAGKDQKALDDQIDKLRERIKKREEAIPKLQKQIAESQAQRDKDIKQIRDRQRTAAEDYAKSMRETKQGLEEAQKQLAQEAAAKQVEISQAESKITQLNLEDKDQEIKYSSNLVAIRMTCHSAATQYVINMQQEALKAGTKRLVNGNSFNQFMREVGVSDLESWELRAKAKYQECMKSAPTFESQKEALKARQLGSERLKVAIQSERENQQRLRKEILQIKGPTGCGQVISNSDGTSNETGTCRALRQTFERQQEIQTKYYQSQQSATEEQQTALIQSSRNEQVAMAELQSAQRDLKEEKARLENLEKYRQLKLEAAGHSNVESKLINEASAKYGDFKSASAKVYRCCKKFGLASNNCTFAENFLKTNIKDFKPIQASPSGGTTIPPTSPPPGASTSSADPALPVIPVLMPASPTSR